MLDAIYRENYRIVYGYLLSLCREPSQAEELTAETFLRAAEHLERYDSSYRVSTWLCTIAKNLFLNEEKKRRRTRSLEETECHAVPSAETLYLQKEQASQVMEAARMLPPLQRQVLFMRLQGMQFREIGAAVGKTENWARVTFFRTKNRILEEMEETV